MDDEQITSNNQEDEDTTSIGSDSYSEDNLGREEDDEMISGENGFSG